MMKKLTALLMALALVLTLAACGTEAPPATDPALIPTAEPTTEPTAAPTEPAIQLPQNPDGDDATAYGPIAIQGGGWGAPTYIDGTTATMDNNCQNLNIWAPAEGENLPVMVWLHSGAFSTGASNTDASTDGTNLAVNGNAIVVSLNHRLNSLGFLDLSAYGEEYAKSGNVGILDIVMALEWIQENIAAFGGDPNNVTIFGESGGGAKVMAMLTCPDAEGLFHKAVNESGMNLAAHTAEVPFVFGNMTDSNGDIQRLQSQMHQAWINFAWTDDPSSDDLHGLRSLRRSVRV